MVEFKVGDQVKRTEEFCLGGRYHERLGTVVAIGSQGHVTAVFDPWDGHPELTSTFLPDELERPAGDFHRQEVLDDPAPADVPVRAQILREAETVITKNRHDQYGSAEDCFGDIAALWTTYFRRTFSAHDVAMAMTLLKIARAKANPKHRDSYVDLAGYCGLAAEMES